jgi:mono/diheme cytochrome c family protein
VRRFGEVLAGVVILVAQASCHSGSPSRDGRSQATVVMEPEGHFALGRAATTADVAALDIDVSPSGAGLPPGHGDVASGERLYRAHCAVCHGAGGEGIAPYPALIGREPREGFPFASDFRINHTIGNYWPYATTLFDYVRRAMPLETPGVLTADETYSITAYLLSANGILPPGASLDSATLTAIRMPARDRFVRDDRHGGPEIR